MHAPSSQAAQSSQSRNNSLTELIVPQSGSKPIGIRTFGFCYSFKSQQNKRNFHKFLVLLMTFIAYAAFHMGRRPLAVVKTVLYRDCPAKSFATAATTNGTGASTSTSSTILDATLRQNIHPTHPCNWAPFDDPHTAKHLLAYLDSAFLTSYAVCMFFSGIIADRTNLRHFISLGAILSGLCLILFGIAHQFEIHSMIYFLIVQIVAGAVQSIGWPVAVTCISNWFESSKRGTIYGLWNSHTSLGNILGATLAGYFVEKDWGLSFIVPGLVMITVGLLLFLFLVPNPVDVDLNPTSDEEKKKEEKSATCSSQLEVIRQPADLDERKSRKTVAVCSIRESGQSSNGGPATRTGTASTETISNTNCDEKIKPISFLTALRIPGVIEYSVCLFFSKLVNYTFLYWLPTYISSSTEFNSEDSAYLSTPFDVGGISGAILAGYLSDKLRVNGAICNVMLLAAIPAMLAYESFGSSSKLSNILLQLIVGALVNGPYCLITTAVSADLGTRIKDGRAMATVSAIIDGMGSVGAVLGPLFSGFVSSDSYKSVFLMLIIADAIASLCIARITVQDIRTVCLDPTKSSSSSSRRGAEYESDQS